MKLAIVCLCIVCFALVGRMFYIETKLKELGNIVLRFMETLLDQCKKEVDNE